jgi:hypothetical protein
MTKNNNESTNFYQTGDPVSTTGETYKMPEGTLTTGSWTETKQNESRVDLIEALTAAWKALDKKEWITRVRITNAIDAVMESIVRDYSDPPEEPEEPEEEPEEELKINAKVSDPSFTEYKGPNVPVQMEDPPVITERPPKHTVVEYLEDNKIKLGYFIQELEGIQGSGKFEVSRGRGITGYYENFFTIEYYRFVGSKEWKS